MDCCVVFCCLIEREYLWLVLQRDGVQFYRRIQACILVFEFLVDASLGVSSCLLLNLCYGSYYMLRWTFSIWLICCFWCGFQIVEQYFSFGPTRALYAWDLTFSDVILRFRLRKPKDWFALAVTLTICLSQFKFDWSVMP